MTLCIILTTAEADAVRGPTAPGAALEPVPLADGVTFVLPEEVLTDPAHGSQHEMLATFPLRVVAEAEWPAREIETPL